MKRHPFRQGEKYGIIVRAQPQIELEKIATAVPHLLPSLGDEVPEYLKGRFSKMWGKILEYDSTRVIYFIGEENYGFFKLATLVVQGCDNKKRADIVTSKLLETFYLEEVISGIDSFAKDMQRLEQGLKGDFLYL